MKKRVKRIIIIVLILAVLAGVTVECCFYVFKTPVYSSPNVEYAEAEELNYLIKDDWKAYWIWTKKCVSNSYVDFRKTFELDAVPEVAVADIAADSKYKLWLNGELVVADGELKRGPTYYDTYYEEVELADYLVAGVNTLCIEVNYFGEDGYDHNDSGQGGLLFELELPNQTVISDGTWKASRNNAYKKDFFASLFSPNYRLAESSVIYDAGKERNWTADNYNDGDWENASVYGLAPAEPWNDLYKRITPAFKDYKIRDFLNSSEYANVTFNKKTTVRLELPYNCQFSPYIKTAGTDGKKIVFRSYRQKQLRSQAVKLTYVTGKNALGYEMFGYMTGEWVDVTIPAGVKIVSIGYRETSYDTERLGSFNCSDEQLNTLWEKSYRSLAVNMRDTFTDCPDRERAAWLADAVNSTEMCFYSMSSSSYLLAENLYNQLIGWSHADGVLNTVSPNGVESFELPVQNLAGVASILDYYLFTGDLETVSKVYDTFYGYLNLYETKNGLVKHRKGSWDWADWGSHTDTAVIENAWYYSALKSLEACATYLGKSSDALSLGVRAEDIYKNFNAEFWTDRGYTSGKTPDDRGNALAVVAGLASADKYSVIEKVLSSTYNSSPYMEKFALKALCLMGSYDLALDRMLNRYGDMISAETSTLWELWDTSASLNHAWGGGAMVVMSGYFAGVRPNAPEYAGYIFSPDTSVLSSIAATIPTIKGDIAVNIANGEDGSLITLTAGFDADIDLCIKVSEHITINGKTVVDGNTVYDSELISSFSQTDGYYIFHIPSADSLEITVAD